jgi:two-component system, LytTR family, sensor kinase
MDSFSYRRPSAPWFWIGSLWLGFALLNATQIVFGMRAEGMHHAWTRLFITMFLSWLVWAVATPLVLRLGQRFPLTRWRSVRIWLIHLSACFALGLAYSAWMSFLQVLLRPWGSEPIHMSFLAVWVTVFYNHIHISIILYAAVLAVGHTLDSRKRLAAQETEAARLNEQLSKARLDALRRQLEPHFLFNTLNAIAGLIREARDEDAVDMIAKLSDLLRRVLEGGDQQEVSLGEEMEFLQKYLEIQRTRFAERLVVTMDVPRQLLSARVPSLILQPMVENAIQHGIGKRVEGGQIRIAASRVDGVLSMSVYNSGPPLPADWEEARSGVGISNTRTRLQNLYGEACVLELRNCESGGVEASLSLPYREGPA